METKSNDNGVHLINFTQFPTSSDIESVIRTNVELKQELSLMKESINRLENAHQELKGSYILCL